MCLGCKHTSCLWQSSGPATCVQIVTLLHCCSALAGTDSSTPAARTASVLHPLRPTLRTSAAGEAAADDADMAEALDHSSSSSSRMRVESRLNRAAAGRFWLTCTSSWQLLMCWRWCSQHTWCIVQASDEKGCSYLYMYRQAGTAARFPVISQSPAVFGSSSTLLQ